VHRHDLSRTTSLNKEGTLNVVEQYIEGRGAWELESIDELSGINNDVLIVHTPGTTYGSLSVWYQPPPPPPLASPSLSTGGGGGGTDQEEKEKEEERLGVFNRETVLFTGRTLGFDNRRQMFSGYSGHNVGCMEDQEMSIRQLVDNPKFVPAWNWLVPAYGACYRFNDKKTQRKEILKAARVFKKEGRRIIGA
jgi:hypothetical protein